MGLEVPFLNRSKIPFVNCKFTIVELLKYYITTEKELEHFFLTPTENNCNTFYLRMVQSGHTIVTLPQYCSKEIKLSIN